VVAALLSAVMIAVGAFPHVMAATFFVGTAQTADANAPRFRVGGGGGGHIHARRALSATEGQGCLLIDLSHVALICLPPLAVLLRALVALRWPAATADGVARTRPPAWLSGKAVTDSLWSMLAAQSAWVGLIPV
jgi:hypothetical protein